MSEELMDVIVVGCGAAGVAALRKLHDAGLKALGLEAAERIGGRIHTQEFGDGVVDVGAAWCHGEKDNIVFELANPLGLLGRPEPDHKWFILSNGEIVPNEVGENIIGIFTEELGKADKNNTKSILEFVRNVAESNVILKKNRVLTKPFLEWFERNNHVGTEADLQKAKSLKGLQEFWPSEGEQMLSWKKRGYNTILDVLLNRLPNCSKETQIKIVLHKEVERIRWRATDENSAQDPLIHITCTDGTFYSSKAVIVTIPVGVLKEKHDQLFNPPLPTEKVTAINTIQQCVLDKIYIEFEKPWWPKSPANFTILWQEEDKIKIKEHSWITEIFGLQTISSSENVLLAWIYGTGAEAMEKLSEDDVKEGVSLLLNVILKKQFDVSPVKNILRTKWKKNRWARGTYSYRSVATEIEGGSAITLSEPLLSGGFPVVCFAGEATSHHRHSSVHGAIESGFRESERLIKELRKSE